MNMQSFVAALSLVIAGCSPEATPLGYRPSEVATIVDLADDSALGFSANDVLDHFGPEREYHVEYFDDDGAPMDFGDPLYSDGYAPFTVAVDATTATAEHVQPVMEDGTPAGIESLRITLNVNTNSAADEVDVTGRTFLVATAVSDNQITWVPQDPSTGEVWLQAGTFPSWVAEQADAMVGESNCAQGASDPSAVALHHVGAVLTGSIARPTLRVGLWWDPSEQSECAGFESLDIVFLVP